MRIVPGQRFNGGEPRISGHRMSVGRVLTIVDREGMGKFIRTYGHLGQEVKEGEGILEAVRYCRSQKCVEDGSFCVGCVRRNESSPDLRVVAEQVRERYFKNILSPIESS